MLPRWANYGRWVRSRFRSFPNFLRPPFMVLSIFAPLPLVVQFNSDQGGFPRTNSPNCLLPPFMFLSIACSCLSIYNCEQQHCGIKAHKHLVDSLLTMKEDSSFSSFQHTHCDWDLEPSHHFRLLGYAGTRHLYHHGFVMIRKVFIIIVNQRIGDICRCWYC